jgi:hypothetical protein
MAVGDTALLTKQLVGAVVRVSSVELFCTASSGNQNATGLDNKCRKYECRVNMNVV